MQSSNPEYLVFLVRIWREPENASRPSTRRGYVVQIAHIPGGEERYFGSLEEMVRYFQYDWLGHLPEPRA